MKHPYHIDSVAGLRPDYVTPITQLTRAALIRQIHAEWPEILKRSGCIPVPIPENLVLLGESKKTRATALHFADVETRVLYLSPAREALLPDTKGTLCPWATTCIDPCLGHNSGHLAMPTQKVARIWKTTLYRGAVDLFYRLLAFELNAFVTRCAKQSPEVFPAVRLDGASDTGIAGDFYKQWREIVFYDYTKSARRYQDVSGNPEAWNYDLCYSFDGTAKSLLESSRILKNGGNVAVVFEDTLPESWCGFPVFNGDTHDFIPSDPDGQVRGLRFKAAADRQGNLEAAGAFIGDEFQTWPRLDGGA